MYQRNSQQNIPVQASNLGRSGSAYYNQSYGQQNAQQRKLFAQGATDSNGPQFLFDNSADKFNFSNQQKPQNQANTSSNPYPSVAQQFTFTQSYNNSSQKQTHTPQRAEVNSYVKKNYDVANPNRQEDKDDSQSYSESDDEEESKDKNNQINIRQNEKEDGEEEDDDDDEEEDEQAQEQDQDQDDEDEDEDDDDDDDEEEEEELVVDQSPKPKNKQKKQNNYEQENKYQLVKLKETEENKNYRSLAQISKIMNEVHNSDHIYKVNKVNLELDGLEKVMENSLLESRIKFNQEFSQNMSLSECAQEDDPDFDKQSTFSYTKYLQEFKQYQDFQQQQNNQPLGNKFTNIFNDKPIDHQYTDKKPSGVKLKSSSKNAKQ